MRIGDKLDETYPQDYPPVLSIPPAAPTCFRPTSIAEGQYGASEQDAKPREKERTTVTATGSLRLIPRHNKAAPRVKHAMGTMRRPSFLPQRSDIRSEAHPPRGVMTIQATKGAVV